MADETPSPSLESAAQINQLIIDLWMATERSGPRYEDFDLSTQQHALLDAVIKNPRIGSRELAEALGVTKGAVSQQLAKLEHDGFIVRERDDRDARKQVLRLAERGRAYDASVRGYEAFLLERYTSRLSAVDVDEIVAALTKLRDVFGPDPAS